MKNLSKLFLLLTLISGSAYASEKSLLQCSTPGDAIGAVDLLIREDGAAVIRVTELDDSPAVDFVVASEFKKLKRFSSTLLIGQTRDGTDFGGGQSNAAILVVEKGKKSAKFASNGFVYHLQCNLQGD